MDELTQGNLNLCHLFWEISTKLQQKSLLWSIITQSCLEEGVEDKMQVTKHKSQTDSRGQGEGNINRWKSDFCRSPQAKIQHLTHCEAINWMERYLQWQGLILPK